MKTLILIRHAESSHDDPSLRDFDRPLSPSGGPGALTMSERLAELHLRIDSLVSSPAVRALSTADVFAHKLAVPVKTIDRIYNAGIPELQETVRSFDDRFSTVVLIGHNPGLSEFLRYLTEEDYADLPPAAVAVVELPLKSWRHTFAGKGNLKNSLCPGRPELGFRHDAPEPRWIDRFNFWRHERAHRLEIIIALVIGLILLLTVVMIIMHGSTDSSAMPQQGSGR